MKRRDFLYNSAAAGLFLASSKRVLAGVSPNEKIQVGCIGVGGMGRGNMGNFMSHDDCEVVAVCDIDPENLGKATKQVEDKYGKAPDQYADFRKLIERKDIDAVMVGTPDHWHALITALACQSGKDVYVEKPLSHNVEEGRIAVEAAKKNKRITQLGTQVHQTENYHSLAKKVQSGVLGSITKVRVWIGSSGTAAGLGNPPDGEPPEGVDYDMWLGPAPTRAYNKNRYHFSWRYFWDYGGGKLGDFGCHIIDPVYMALGLEAPKTVTGIGDRYLFEDNTETYDTQEVVWEYDAPKGQSNPFQLVWSLTQANPYGVNNQGLGILFQGTEGTILASYGKWELFDPKGKVVESSEIEGDTVGKAGLEHKREFLDAIKSRERTSCDIEYGHKVTTVPLTGNIASRVGRKLEWDAATESFKNDDEANALLSREHREAWSPKALGIDV